MLENVKPDTAAFGHGLLRVDEDDTVTKSFGENADKLTGESDFGNEEDGGFLRFKGISGHFKVDIGFTTTGDATKEFSALRRLLKGLESIFLSKIERDEG